MIIEYHRPGTLGDVFRLLSREEPRTMLLGGGLYINEMIKHPVAVVDLQDLDLTGITKKGKYLHLGAMEKLQALVESNLIPPELARAITLQETYNRRQVATLGGTLVSASGRSAVGMMALALDAEMVLLGEDQVEDSVRFGDLLPIRDEMLAGKLITEIRLPVGVTAAYEYVARSPADLPIVAAAAAQWPGGRTRIVLGGYGTHPRMVFDGEDAAGAELAARDAYSQAEDQWASAAYRGEIAPILVGRCLARITSAAED
jgi:CO/xanthine dehydrogenase FAD-binding subunit